MYICYCGFIILPLGVRCIAWVGLNGNVTVTHEGHPETAFGETKSDSSSKCSAVGVVTDLTGSETAKTERVWIKSIFSGA